jgi:hypothetical protein
MDVVQLYQDYSVDFRTEGHKHCRPGWVNTPCPFCISDRGHEGYHLGFELDSNHYYCWRCGWHPIVPTVAKLLNLKEQEVRRLIKGYGLLVPKYIKPSTEVKKIVEHRMPSSTGPLEKRHKQYLEGRGFDADKLEAIWNLVGTTHISLLDGISYKQRIIIPVLWDLTAVSFISRDITDKHLLRYITCPKAREIIHHKHIVYGKQEEWTSTGICVEGATDVWRFGTRAFATFGIEFTHQQIRVIARNFKRVHIVFDPETQALKQARKLKSELTFRGVETYIVTGLTSDPGKMKQDDADHLVKQLI